MILRNWINFFSASAVAQSNTATRSVDTAGRTTAYGTPGNYGSSTDVNLNWYTEVDGGGGSGSYSPQYMRITLGSGDTQPTIDDYKMDSALVNVLTHVGESNPRVSSPSSEGWSKLMWSQTVTNNTQDPVVVKEIGIFGRVSTGVAAARPCVLYTRDVIDPVTIQVGETKTFIITIDFTQAATSVQTN